MEKRFSTLGDVPNDHRMTRKDAIVAFVGNIIAVLLIATVLI